MLSIELTSHRGNHIEDFNAATARKLADYHFEVVKRSAYQQQHDQIWNEERSATIFKSCEGKTPHIPEADGHCDA